MLVQKMTVDEVWSQRIRFDQVYSKQRRVDTSCVLFRVSSSTGEASMQVMGFEGYLYNLGYSNGLEQNGVGLEQNLEYSLRHD